MLCIDSDNLCILVSKCKTKTDKYKSDFIRWLFDIGLLSQRNIVIESRQEIDFFDKLQYRINLYNSAFIDVYNMQSCTPIAQDTINKINPLADVKLELQKVVCNGKYRLDCYIKKYNLIIEFDEAQHKYTQKADINRVNEIKKWFADNDNADLYVIRVDENNPDYFIELIIGYMTIPI